MTSRAPLLTIIASCVALVACSTAQVALDQANNGVSLTQSLQQELSLYQAKAKLAAQRSLKDIERVELTVSELDRDQSYDTYLMNKSGQANVVAARERLSDASETYSKWAADNDRARREIAGKFSELVKDLPSPTAKLSAVQKALADLGTELSPEERLVIVTKFLSEAKTIAKGSAGAASAPATPASAP